MNQQRNGAVPEQVDIAIIGAGGGRQVRFAKLIGIKEVVAIELEPAVFQAVREDLLDDSTRLAERTRAAGVDTSLEVWDDMAHGWHLWAPILPEGQQAIERIGEFVRSCLG